MKDNTKTNTLLLTVIGVATLLVAVIGATFAYFTAQVGGGESTTTVKMNAGVLKIDFTNGNVVQSTTGFQPTKAAEECRPTQSEPGDSGGYYCDQSQYTPVATKKFTLTGTNSTLASDGMKMPYTIKLVVTQNEFSDGAIKYTLVGTKTGGNAATGELASVPTWVDVKSGAQAATVIGSGYFSAGSDIKHNYDLNIYFPDNHENQDIDKNKVFGAKVEIGTAEITK